MAKTAGSKTISRVARTRRSKADVEAEFAAIVDETEATEVRDQKVAELSLMHDQEVRRAVENLTVEGVAQKISAVGVETSRALARVSEQLIEQVRELEQVREAVSLERAEIERLHKLDIAQTSVDQLVADHLAKKHQLEAEYEAQEVAWAGEEEERQRARREQDEAQKKAREREAEEYEYKKVQERKKAQDKFDEQMQKLDKQNREKQEALEKGWQEREASIKTHEEEYASLKKEVASFPDRLKGEVGAATTRAIEEARREHETQMKLLTKEVEGDQRVSALQIKALEEIAAKQAAQIADLSQQLNEAKRQVQEIAVKALESAAGAKTLEEVRQIAREQAKRDTR